MHYQELYKAAYFINIVMAKLRYGLVGIFLSFAAAQSDCNPLSKACPAVPGFTSGFTDDMSDISKNWVVADGSQPLIGPTSKGFQFQLTGPKTAPYIWTKNYMHYGKVEVVMQSAPGIGVISSAVLMSDTRDEIDWEWSGNDFGYAQSTVQTNYFGKGITGDFDRGTQPQVAFNMTKQFATYTLDWKPDSTTWSINGNVIRTMYAKNADAGNHQYPQSPSQFHLGAWDAGDKDVSWYTVVWAAGYGVFTDPKGFPYNMYVKSVTVTPYKSCASYNATDKSGSDASFKCLDTPVSTATPTTIAKATPTYACTASAPAQTQPGAPDGCARYYQVKSGDNCQTIADSLSVNIADLKSWNSQVGADCYNLWLNYYSTLR